MITFATCILSGATSVTISGMVYNLFFVTLGNMVGGILFLGAGTYFLCKSGDKKETKMDKVKNNIISLAVSSFNLYAAKTPEQTNMLHKIPLKNNWYAVASIFPNAVYS